MQQCDKFTVLTSVVVVNPSICLPLLKMCPVTVNRITAVIANRPAPAKKKKKEFIPRKSKLEVTILLKWFKRSVRRHILRPRKMYVLSARA